MATRTSAGSSRTATWITCDARPNSATGSSTWRRLRWLTSCAAILSITLLAHTLTAQEETDFSGLSAPSAIDRARAAAEIDDDALHAHYRDVLKNEEGSSTLIIRALENLGRKQQSDDIPLIIKYIGHLEPSVAAASMEALRRFGRKAMQAVKELDDGEVDQQTRKDVIERLLKDHVIACCARDREINPFQLAFEGRFDELYSIDADVDELLFRLLRDSISEIRDDIAGNRYYYGWGYGNNYERPFIDYGGLAIAALAQRQPEKLLRETEELAETETETGYYWGYTNHAPVTVELAIFFAHQEKTALVDKLINEMESSMRWRGGGELGVQMQIAALQINALGEYDAALDRLTEHLKQAGSAFSTTVSLANYLRARILMHLGEEGAALHSLEESMEASDRPVVLALVDSSFKALEDERRYQAVLKYCELAARRLRDIQRPWQPDEEEE